MLLPGKVVVVTGVGPGMGSKLCRIAAAEGAEVVVSARSADFVDQVVEQIRADGGRAIGVPTDVSEADQCARLAEATLAAFGRIDGLVNSARARNPRSTLEDADLGTWASLMDVTCVGALRMAQAVLPAMKRQGGGAIVNIGTIASVVPSPGEADYAVAKSALGGLTRQMAGEFGRYNVRVNQARMGWLWGASVKRHLESRAVREGRTVEDLRERVARQIPLGIIPPDDECAKGVLTLLSDYTRMITGATLDINGGLYMPA